MIPTRLSLVLLLLTALPAAAQLDQTCTVSILNRTAQVEPDGRWVIPNVPANQGPVRARATCVENGILRAGASGYFTVPINGEIGVPGIVFDAVPPVPARMTLTAPKTSLPNIGDTVQLNVVLTFPDGTTRSVPSTSQGTSYTTSNPRIVTINSNGLLTAAGAGTAIISAMNEGSLAMLRIGVATSSLDSDGDGMPDDWETTFGFNPNDPSDAAQDADGDGLSNLNEFQISTDPRRADTDGDGIRDGLEVQVGSDPLDPNSFDLARSLRGISITPNPLNILINPVLGQASRLVTVTGQLIDNFSIDLTARSRGTVYSTANVNIASLSTYDGRIIAQANGTTTITATNSGFTANATVNVTTFTPTTLATVALNGYANDIALAGNHLFIASGSAGLQIVNTTSRTVAGSYPTRGNSNDVEMRGNLAYLAEGSGGMQIVDVSVPTAPQAAGWVDTPGAAYDLAVASNGFVYVADGTSGLAIIDATTPATANIVATLPLGNVRSVDVAGTIAVAFTLEGYLHFIDVSQPSAPVVRATLLTGDGRDVRVSGTRVYFGSTFNGLVVIDITNPAAPVQLGTAPQAGRPWDLAVVGGFVLAGDALGSGGVTVIDVSDPRSPLFRARVANPLFTTGVAADSKFLYRLGASTYAKPGTTGSSTLYISEYVRMDDTSLAPPFVRITAPSNGASYVDGMTIDVTADSFDDVGVVMTELLGNGTVVSASNTTPYKYRLTIPIGGPSSLALTVRATDGARNIAVSTAVTLQTARDTAAPVVSIVQPPLPLVGGRSVSLTVNATDNVLVRNVELFADGVSLGVRTSSPYVFSFTVPNGKTSITFLARAIDPSNNTGTATVTYPAQPDQAPVVTLMSPTSSTLLYDGAEIRARIRATDDVGIHHVELRVNGVSVASDSRTAWYSELNEYELYYELPAGTRTVTIQAAAVDSISQATVSPAMTFNVKATSALGTAPLAALGWDVDVQDNLAYVAGGTAGLQIVDVSNPSAPVLMATLDTPGDARQILLLGRYAIIGELDGTLQVADVSTPAAPVLAGSLLTGSQLRELSLYRDRIYVATDLGLYIVDISNAAVPRLVRHIDNLAAASPVTTWAARVEGDLLIQVIDYVTFTNTCYACVTMTISDLSANPDQPQLLSTFGPSLPNWNQDFEPGDYVSLAAGNGRVYVLGEDWVLAFDITNPSAPQYLGYWDARMYRYGWTDMNVRGALGIVSYAERQEYRAWLSDLRDPKSLMMNGAIDFTALGPYHGTAMAATHELAYTTGLSRYVDDLDDGPTTSQLYIGRFDTIADTGGVAPAATIQSARNTAFERQTVPVRVLATDDVAVATVRLSVDGVTVGTDRVAPFDFLFTTAAGATTHTLVATAVDYAGNSAQSAPVTITVTSDPVAPSITMTSPAAGESLPTAVARLRAGASDNFSVARVEFVVNGVVVATDSSVPYEYDYAFPAGMTSINVLARAFDPAGNSAATPQRTVSVTAPATLASLTFPAVSDVDVNGDYAYVAAGTAGLKIVNIADPQNPVVAATLAFPAFVDRVRLHGSHALVHRQDSLVSIVDVSNPLAPVIRSSVSGGSASGAGSWVYTSGNPLRAFDISDPLLPVKKTEIPYGETVFSEMQSLGDYGVVAKYGTYGGWWDLSAFRMQNALPYATGGLSFVNRNPIAGIRAKDGMVAFASGNGVMLTSLTDRFTWSATVPPTNAFDVDLLDHYLFATTKDAPPQVLLFDVTNERSPVLRTSLNFGAIGATTLQALSVTPTHILGVGNDAAGAGRLFVARYRQFDDAFGIKPVVTLIAPATGRWNRLLTLEARPSDDVGVKAVVFTINGADAFTDTVAPYEWNYTVPNGSGTVTAGARSIDFGGNVSTTVTAAVGINP